MRKILILLPTVLCCLWSGANAQPNFGKLRIFGYFQTLFQHEDFLNSGEEQNTFNVQQLNLFLQNEIKPRWTVFINVDITNNFSADRDWGTLDLQEAWVRYRASSKLNLKLGQHIPTFNHLNAIKNKTPVLPYIIRPLVYETSLRQDTPIDEFVPDRAYASAYGFFRKGANKFRYDVYLGNSPNIRAGGGGLTGTDSTDTILIGGRVGVRRGVVKLGVSGTHDVVKRFSGLEERVGGTHDRFDQIGRVRAGADFSFDTGKVAFESEYISVTYLEDADEFNFDKAFAYGTLGYHLTDDTFVYGTYWWMRFDDVIALEEDEMTPFTARFTVASAGFAHHLGNRLTMKGAFAVVDQDSKTPGFPESTFLYYGTALSVFF